MNIDKHNYISNSLNTTIKSHKIAFTLVELAVSIFIISILGTIGFISMQGYSTDSRDAKRVSDIGSLKNSLELYKVYTYKFPTPSDSVNITYSGAIVWSQGTFGESVNSVIGNREKIPRDPLTDKEYTYSVTSSKKEFEIGGILEGGDNIVKNNILTKSNAGETTAFAYITGNYNGIVTKSSIGKTCNILAIPSIITNDINITDLQDLITNNNFVFNGYKNLPSGIIGSKFKHDGGFVFKPNKLLVYTDEKSCEPLIKPTLRDRFDLLKSVQEAYVGTLLEDSGEIKNILSMSINPSSPSIEVEDYAGVFINNVLLWKVDTVSSINPPSIPTGLYTLNQSDVAFNAFWDSATGATEYGIYLNDEFLGYTSFTGVVISDLTADTTYNFTITSKNLKYESVKSTILSITTAPPAPTVTALGSNDTEIGVSWNSVPGAIAYGLYLNGIYMGTGATTSGTFNGLTANTNYNITITTIKTNTGSVSRQSTALTYSTAPKYPTTYNLSFISDNKFTMDWNSATGATEYDVYKSTSLATFTGTTNNFSGSLYSSPTINNLDVTGLAANTNYYFAFVSKKSPLQKSHYYIVGPAKTAPRVPINFQKTAASDNLIVLGWTASPGAWYYKIYKEGVFIGSTFGTSANVGTLTANTSYTFNIRAVNILGYESDLSSNLVATTAPAIPTNFMMTHISNDSISLEWDAMPGATQYAIYLSGSYYGSNLGYKTYLGLTNTNSVDLEGLLTNSNYTFNIRSVDSGGFASNYTSNLTGLSAPTNGLGSIINMTTTSTGTGTASFTWNVMPGATKYYSYVFGHFKAQSIDNSYNILDVSNLVPNTAYSIRVVGVQGSGAFGTISSGVASFGLKTTKNITTLP